MDSGFHNSKLINDALMTVKDRGDAPLSAQPFELRTGMDSSSVESPSRGESYLRSGRQGKQEVAALTFGLFHVVLLDLVFQK